MIPLDEQIRLYEAWSARIAACTNVGRTGDTRDLYVQLDGLLAEMATQMPPVACGDGCNLCCYSPPMVTSVEYAAVHQAMLAAPEDVQRAIVATALRLRPMAASIAAHRWMRLHPSGETPPGLSLQCPFLVGGSCSVYAGRPLICRGYGLTMYGDDDGPSLFACNLARAHFDATFKPLGPFALPAINPYEEFTEALNRQNQGESAYLPQWLWAHLDGERLVSAFNPRPGFDAAFERARAAQ